MYGAHYYAYPLPDSPKHPGFRRLLLTAPVRFAGPEQGRHMAFAVMATLLRLAPDWESLCEALRTSLSKQGLHTAPVFRYWFDGCVQEATGLALDSGVSAGDVAPLIRLWTLSAGRAENGQRRIAHATPTEAIVGVTCLARKRSRAGAYHATIEHAA